MVVSLVIHWWFMVIVNRKITSMLYGAMKHVCDDALVFILLENTT
jgi:hypothetical protein